MLSLFEVRAYVRRAGMGQPHWPRGLTPLFSAFAYLWLSLFVSLSVSFLTVQVFMVGLLRLDPGQGCRLLRALFMPQ